MKHMNISAVMLELGYPCIDGYKPASNYQRKILPDIVAELVAEHVELHSLIQSISEYDGQNIPTVSDILSSLVDTPLREKRQPQHVKEKSPIYESHKIDYLTRDAVNTKLGLLGEKFVVNFEQARLIAAGKESLADKIEHTSQILGDGTGYDVRSYEENGSDRFIEVKTTKYSRYTPFFLTRNELVKSIELDRHYYLYRVFSFFKKPRFFTLHGDIKSAVSLTPTQYIAHV